MIIPEPGMAFLAKVLKKHGYADNAYHASFTGQGGRIKALHDEKIPQYPLY
ncbi:hypothetical protein [Acidiferrobacter sp. SPIII_3]|jgi:hypothetical protein|uniref:hypothetical protein n=1 Tax=Acidiferrobacter sp. SPIII_3 TaxID=1281578 RepID=UPI00143D5288|nr:hypothetical protein [Acidiferrobacter sp. SPIII_3]